MSLLLRWFRRLGGAALIFMLIEFTDELVYGALETSWPLIRADLGLTYTQIGLALSLPILFGNLVEPVMGIFADTGKKRALILGGGVVFAAALFWVSRSTAFVSLLIAACLLSPASGAFVGLSQARWMDLKPERTEQNMARWTFAGSVGVTLGPLALSGAMWLGWGWRGLLAVLALAALLALAAAVRFVPGDQNGTRTRPDETDNEVSADYADEENPISEQSVSSAQSADESGVSPLTFGESLKGALEGLRRWSVVRWFVLLQFSDLMLDVLYSFLALYLVDVAGVSVERAALGVAVWSGVGLLGDFLLIPLLERVKGLVYLRWSVLIELALFPLFLLLEPFWAKLAVLGLLGFFNAGWYSVLSGQAYKSMPGRSGAVLALNNVAGWFGALLPLGIGLAAERLGLGWAMWLLLAGPVALLVGLPRK